MQTNKRKGVIVMKCPHGNELNTVKRMGISTYCHEDGVSCSMLDNGDVSLRELNKTYLEKRKPPLNSRYVQATIEDRCVVEYVIDGMTKADITIIEAALSGLHKTKRLDIGLMKAMAENFGRKQVKRLFMDIGLHDENSCNHREYSYWQHFSHFDNNFFKEKKRLKCYKGVDLDEPVAEQPIRERVTDEISLAGVDELTEQVANTMKNLPF
jgi:hypothetical protein